MVWFPVTVTRCDILPCNASDFFSFSRCRVPAKPDQKSTWRSRPEEHVTFLPHVPCTSHSIVSALHLHRVSVHSWRSLFLCTRPGRIVQFFAKLQKTSISCAHVRKSSFAIFQFKCVLCVSCTRPPTLHWIPNRAVRCASTAKDLDFSEKDFLCVLSSKVRLPSSCWAPEKIYSLC